MSSPAKHEYIGTDIFQSIFPKEPPENITFQIQSIKDPWPPSMQESFDLVHQRFVLAGAAPGPLKPLLANMIGLLKPGGWLQLVEIDTDPIPETPPEMEHFMGMMRALFAGIGLGNFANQLSAWMKELGLRDVHEKVVHSAHGETIGDKSLKEKSMASLCSAVTPVTQVLQGTNDPRSSCRWILIGFSTATCQS